MNQPAIVAENLVKRFGEVTALDGIDFTAPEGAVYGLLGPNGAGKTTAIRILSTLLKPDSGRAVVGGHDVAAHPAKVRRLIGLTGQYAAVDELLSGRENLSMIGRLIGLGSAEAKRRATELLDSFELSESGRATVKTYSGGMRRRLDLAASLVGRPPFLYLDEPTTGLDPRGRRGLWDLIRALVADGTTVLLTTQYLEEADQLADGIVVIDHGKVVVAGSPEELKRKVGGQVVEIRPGSPADVGRTRSVLEAIPGAVGSVESDAQVVTVPVNDPAFSAAALRRLDEAGIVVSHAEIREPSLDDVFLALTGHPAEPEHRDGTHVTDKSKAAKERSLA